MHQSFALSDVVKLFGHSMHVHESLHANGDCRLSQALVIVAVNAWVHQFPDD